MPAKKKLARRKPTKATVKKATVKKATVKKATVKKASPKKRVKAALRSPGSIGSATAKASPQSKPRSRTFVDALSDLMRGRGLPIPPGLLEARPEAYAGEPASVVETLTKLPDGSLVAYASKIAGFAQRRAERARATWESSPLIRELRKRGLAEPSQPERVVGVAFSLKKPLAEWTDEEVAQAAMEWSRRGS